jgi:mandelate racemase
MSAVGRAEPGSMIERISVSSILYRLPPQDVITSPWQTYTDRAYVLVQIEGDGGEHGLGYVRCATSMLRTCLYCTADLAVPLLGRSVIDIEGSHALLRATTREFGSAGLHLHSISALDIAMWDLRSRVLGLPLHRLLGGARASVPAYASAVWGGSPAEVKDEVSALAKSGFGGIKMRMGAGSTLELDRVMAAREHFDGRLMIEAGARWDPAEALTNLRAVAPASPYWVEDPVPIGDKRTLRALRQDGVAPIAGGEWAYGPEGIVDVLASELYDHMIFDVQRLGGISGWIQANAIARAHGVNVSSHIYPYASVHLLCGLGNANMLEYIDWGNELLIDPPVPAAGVLTPPDGAGLGVHINEAVVRDSTVESLLIPDRAAA